jgi:hypothetical protein
MSEPLSNGDGAGGSAYLASRAAAAETSAAAAAASSAKRGEERTVAVEHPLQSESWSSSPSKQPSNSKQYESESSSSPEHESDLAPEGKITSASGVCDMLQSQLMILAFSSPPQSRTPSQIREWTISGKMLAVLAHVRAYKTGSRRTGFVGVRTASKPNTYTG